MQRGDICVRKRWVKTALNKGEQRQSCVQISSSGLLSDIFKASFFFVQIWHLFSSSDFEEVLRMSLRFHIPDEKIYFNIIHFF